MFGKKGIWLYEERKCCHQYPVLLLDDCKGVLRLKLLSGIIGNWRSHRLKHDVDKLIVQMTFLLSLICLSLLVVS